MPRIAILGAGISGLLAARALEVIGFNDFKIFDRDVDAHRMKGVHYLHDGCGLGLLPVTLYNVVMCNDQLSIPADLYAYKIFGDNPPPTNSMQKLKVYESIYDMRDAHAMLFDHYANKIFERSIDRKELENLSKEYDYVISTLPSNKFFEGSFPVEMVWMKNGLPEAAYKLDKLGLFSHFTLYNVNRNVDWYRASMVMGVSCTELKHGGDFQIPKIKDGEFTNDLPNVILAGRYARWERGYLAHQVYYDTMSTFQKLLGGYLH